MNSQIISFSTPTVDKCGRMLPDRSAVICIQAVRAAAAVLRLTFDLLSLQMNCC